MNALPESRMAEENESSHPLPSGRVGDPSKQTVLALWRTMLAKISGLLQDGRSQFPVPWENDIPDFERKVEDKLAKQARTKEVYADQNSLGGRLLSAAKLVSAGKHLRLGQGVPTRLQAHAPTLIPTPGMSVPPWQLFHEVRRQEQLEEQRQQSQLKILQSNEELGSSSGISSSRIRASSSSNSYLSPIWDEQEMDLWEDPIFSTSDPTSRFDVNFSSLHSNLFDRVVSRIPMEKLFEVSSVSKNWETLIMHGDHYSQHPIQPSTRNGPIAVVLESGRVSIKTYNGKLKVWLDQDMRYFLKQDCFFYRHSNGDFSAAGSLLYRYHRDFQHYRRVISVIDICNPITKEYRRLEVPLADAVDQGRCGKYQKAMVLGVLMEKQSDRYKVVLQREMSVRNGDGSEYTINHILMYNSAYCLWEDGGTLSPGIVARVGRGVYCSISSGGNFYFLTTDFRAANFDWREPRLLKYHPQSRGCTEISPLPEYAGRWGGPIILEHKGEVMFVTRDARPRRRYENPCYEWVFFRLQEKNADIWERIKEMPEDVADTLTKRITTVRCQGNGDMVYFYGPEKRDRSTQTISLSVCILAHDLVANSWIWLTDISAKDKPFDRLDLLSIEPSLTKV